MPEPDPLECDEAPPAPNPGLGATEQPDVVVVVPGAAAAAGSPVAGSVPGSVPAGVAPPSTPLEPHSVWHLEATHAAKVCRAAFVAHSAALSFVLRQT